MNKTKNITREKVLDLITPLVGQANNITIPRAFIYATGSLEAALLLSQIIYWTDRTSMDNGWFAKSYKEWFEEIHLSEYQVRKATETLQPFGVETIIRKFAGAPTVHYRLNSEVFEEWILKKLQERKSKNLGMEPEKTSGTSTSPTSSPTAAPTAVGRNLKSSKKKKEMDYTQHDALITAWATALELPGVSMGVTYIEDYRRAEAAKLLEKNVTPDEVFSFIRTFKSGREDYRFGYLLRDIIECREKNIKPAPAPRPVVTLEAPITLTDDELAERRRLVEATRAERERMSA